MLLVIRPQDRSGMTSGDFGRPDRDGGRMSFASVGLGLRATVENGARAVAARLGKSHKTLIRTLPIIDQSALILLGITKPRLLL